MSVKKIEIFSHQAEAIFKLRTGSILMGGVGSGKSLTSLLYYYKVCGGVFNHDLSALTPMKNPLKLYIITTARKRDETDWEEESKLLNIVPEAVDSWNNIKKYANVENSFFIFDEQKVVGSGAWSKSFIKISKKNEWILLTATPGDTWMDYISVFIANGFYKNKTEFIREHVVYNSFVNFPKVHHYINEDKLRRLRDSIIIKMVHKKKTTRHDSEIVLPYDTELWNKIANDRWNVFEDRPIKNSGEYCYLQRRVVNSSQSRLNAVSILQERHPRLIVFYNFNYELDMLRILADKVNFPVAEYNGHIHEDVPTGHEWIYLVQYMSGSEAWNCITTNAMVFYSLNYSYKITTQAAGRIDRANNIYLDLYYYYLISEAPIDHDILKAFKNKTDFNEVEYLKRKKISFA